MLDSWRDLQEGQVYLFKGERYRYALQSETAQYERWEGLPERHYFTRWPEAPISPTLTLSDEEVDGAIAKQEIIAI